MYAYFFSALLGRQFIERTDVGGGKYEEPDMYFPFFTALQVKKEKKEKRKEKKRKRYSQKFHIRGRNIVS